MGGYRDDVIEGCGEHIAADQRLPGASEPLEHNVLSVNVPLTTRMVPPCNCMGRLESRVVISFIAVPKDALVELRRPPWNPGDPKPARLRHSWLYASGQRPSAPALYPT